MQAILKETPGVKSVNVNFDKKTVSVDYDRGKTSPEQLAARLSEGSGGRYTMKPQP